MAIERDDGEGADGGLWMTATKVTGDSHVPQGRQTFRSELSPATVQPEGGSVLGMQGGDASVLRVGVVVCSFVFAWIFNGPGVAIDYKTVRLT